jgi:hypothetical protein
MSIKNTMKTMKISKVIMLVALLAASTPFTTFAAEKPADAATEVRATELQNRLEEIKSIETKDLTRAEKRALRTEVKQIKKEMAEISGGVYLSVGAIILIALLLILLL